jgi:signal transduction histidine kinase
VNLHEVPDPSARRLAHLFDISVLLTGDEPPEVSLPRLVDILHGEIAFRSAVVVLDARGPGQAIDVHPERVGAPGREVTREHALRWAAYLCGRSRTSAVELTTPARPEASLTLPLIVAGSPPVGALQLVDVTGAGEADLSFVNRVAGLLAVALARRVPFDRRAPQGAATLDASQVRMLRAEGSREHFEALIDNLDGAFVWEADARTLALTYVSARAAELLGAPLRDWLATPGSWVERVRAEDRDPFVAMLRAAQAGASEPAADHRWATADGRELWLRSAVHLAGAPSAPLLQGVSVDVSVAKSTEARMQVRLDITTSVTERLGEEVRAAEQAQRFLAEESELLAASLDPQVTRAVVTELAVPTLADVCFVDLCSEGGSAARMDAAQAQVLRTGESLLVVGARPRSLPIAGGPGGAAAPGAVRSMVVMPLAARGRTLGVITFAMTASGRAYSTEHLPLLEAVVARAAIALDNAGAHQQVSEHRRAREEILGVVAHDLRNPLSVVLGALTLLRETEPTARQVQLLSMIQRAAGRMQHLIGDLLDTSSLDEGRLSLIIGEHPADLLLSEAMEAMAATPAGKTLTVSCDAVGVADIRVLCDRARILQVLSNLIGNAIKFTPDRGTVRLDAHVAGTSAVFSVSDSGPGMTEEQLAHAFDRFWQARETSRLGIGLGLSICKAIVEAHGHRLEVESVLGQGCRFFFTVPIAVDRGSVEAAHA